MFVTSFKLEPEFYVASEAPLFISYPDKRDVFLEEVLSLMTCSSVEPIEFEYVTNNLSPISRFDTVT